MYATTSNSCAESVDVSIKDERVLIHFGTALLVSLDFAEGVDLVDALATALGSITPLIEQEPARPLHRDENTVRAAADAREAL